MSTNININLPMDIDGSSSSKINQKVPTLAEWNKHEKFLLMQGIKKYGSKNVKKISVTIPSKTSESIQNAIEYYTKLASKPENYLPKPLKERPRKNYSPRPPLSDWVKYLITNHEFEDLETQTVHAMRLIAECEDFPSPDQTDNIDFNKIYHTLANAMEGRPIPDDPKLKEVLYECLMQTAMASKKFITESNVKEIVKSITPSKKDFHEVPKHTFDIEVAATRHLASQRSYNPLNISDTYLKPSI